MKIVPMMVGALIASIMEIWAIVLIVFELLEASEVGFAEAFTRGDVILIVNLMFTFPILIVFGMTIIMAFSMNKNS